MQVTTARAQQAELDLMHIIIYQLKNAWRETLLEKTRRMTECLAAGYLRVHTICQVRGSREDVTALSHITTVSSCDNHICTIVGHGEDRPEAPSGGPLRRFRHSVGRHCRVELALAVEM